MAEMAVQRLLEFWPCKSVNKLISGCLLPSFRFTQKFIIFRRVVLEICDSSFSEFNKIRGPYGLRFGILMTLDY